MVDNKKDYESLVPDISITMSKADSKKMAENIEKILAAHGFFKSFHDALQSVNIDSSVFTPETTLGELAEVLGSTKVRFGVK